MNDIGINVRVNAQTDSLKQAASDFSRFQEQLSSVMGITDPEVAESYWQEYNSGLEKAVRIRDQLSMIRKRESSAGGEGDGGGAPGGRGGEAAPEGGGERGRVLPFSLRDIGRTQNLMTSLVRGGSRDAAGTGLGAADSLLGLAGSVPKLSAGLAGAIGVAMVGVGAGIVGNELSKTYEAIGPALMEATGALRLFGKTSEEQAAKFQITMNEMSSSASKYGYTLEQSLELVTGAARGGARMGTERDIADRVMNLSRRLGYSAPVQEFADLATLGSRFRQDNALEVAYGGAANTIGTPRAREQATALASMFEDALGQGIEKSFKDLGATQNWLFRVFGERAAGTGGAQIYSGLSNAVRSSTSLSNETDILKFQAARALTPGGSDLDALKTLEGGFSEDLFKQFSSLISGASDWDKTFLTSKAFGVSLTTAGQMLAAPDRAREAYEKEVGTGGGEVAGTPLVQILKSQEEIANQIRNLGVPMAGIKASVMTGASDIVKAILGDAEKKVEEVKADINTGGVSKDAGGVITGNALAAGMTGGFNMFMPGQIQDSVMAVKIHNAQRDNQEKLSKLPKKAAEQFAALETYDTQKGWSNDEYGMALDYYDQVKNYKGDMGAFTFQPPAGYGIFGPLEYSARSKKIPGQSTNERNLNGASQYMTGTRQKIAGLGEYGRSILRQYEFMDAEEGFSDTELKYMTPWLKEIDKATDARKVPFPKELGVFGQFEPYQMRMNKVGVRSGDMGKLDELNLLMSQNRDKVAKLQLSERNKIAALNPGPIFSGSEMDEMIRVLKEIAKNSSPEKMTLTINSSLFDGR